VSETQRWEFVDGTACDDAYEGTGFINIPGSHCGSILINDRENAMFLVSEHNKLVNLCESEKGVDSDIQEIVGKYMNDAEAAESQNAALTAQLAEMREELEEIASTYNIKISEWPVTPPVSLGKIQAKALRDAADVLAGLGRSPAIIDDYSRGERAAYVQAAERIRAKADALDTSPAKEAV
jgi:hypothetical protein